MPRPAHLAPGPMSAWWRPALREAPRRRGPRRVAPVRRAGRSTVQLASEPATPPRAQAALIAAARTVAGTTPTGSPATRRSRTARCHERLAPFSVRAPAAAHRDTRGAALDPAARLARLASRCLLLRHRCHLVDVDHERVGAESGALRHRVSANPGVVQASHAGRSAAPGIPFLPAVPRRRRSGAGPR
jgi:hypothetical protein